MTLFQIFCLPKWKAQLPKANLSMVVVSVFWAVAMCPDISPNRKRSPVRSMGTKFRTDALITMEILKFVR